MTGTGSLPGRIMRVLGEHPEGMSTPQIADLCAPGYPSRQRAQTVCGQVLRYHEKAGHVRRVGKVPGARQRGPAVIWALAPPPPRPCITEADLSDRVYGLFPRTPLAARAVYAMAAAGYYTFEDLLYVTGADLMRECGFGPGCLEVTRDALWRRGFVLVDELDPDDLEDEAGS